MPLPTNSDVHVNTTLTNISVAFMQNAASFISNQVFPNVPVMKQSDRYFIYNRGDFNRDEAEKRAPGTESAGNGFRLDNTPNYFCDVRAFHKDVDRQVIANADAALNPMDDAARFVMQKLMINKEVDFASTFMTGGVWDNDYDGVASGAGTNETIQWSDTTNGDPIGDVTEGIDTILANTGIEPNTLVLGKQVFTAVQNHPDMIDRVKYSGGVGNNNPAMVTAEAMAQVFGVDRVLISKAVKNSAAEGATESSDFIVGKSALLVHAAPNPGLMVPTAGYTFSWQGYLGTTNPFGIATSQIPMDHLKSERIEGEMAYDHKLVSSALGFYWDSIAA